MFKTNEVQITMLVIICLIVCMVSIYKTGENNDKLAEVRSNNGQCQLITESLNGWFNCDDLNSQMEMTE